MTVPLQVRDLLKILQVVSTFTLANILYYLILNLGANIPITCQRHANIHKMQQSRAFAILSPHESLDSTLHESRNPVPSPLGDFTALPFDIRALIWEQLMPRPRPVPEAPRPLSKGSSTQTAPQTGSSGLQTIQESPIEVSQKPGCKSTRRSNLGILRTSKALNEEVLRQLYASRTISLGLHADHVDVNVLNKELKHPDFECEVYRHVDWKRLRAIDVHILPPSQRSEFPVQVLQLRRLMQFFVTRLHNASKLPVISVHVWESDLDEWAADGVARRSFQITDLTTGHNMSDLDVILSPLRQLHDRQHQFGIYLPERDFDWRESVVLGLSIVPGKWERISSHNLGYVPTVDVDWSCPQAKAAAIRSNESLDVTLALALTKMRGKRATEFRACLIAKCTCETCIMQGMMIPRDFEIMAPYDQFSRIDDCASPRLRLHTLSLSLKWKMYGIPGCIPSKDYRYARARASSRFSRLEKHPEEETTVQSKLETEG